ncbi:porin [Zwartia sp.]|uniref:porin n=1 Tax=Zwartia sp. TaxID=2978004 RepID=UPI0027219367|nr:porin [Zwartia sp.]MDO9025836.1 porin [Zwartia sp.]
MKKTLLAAALLAGFAGAASAQSSVTLYGILDGGLRYTSVSLANGDGVTNFGLGYGMQSGNRFGLKGVEDIGGGNKVTFVLENGFEFGNGTAQQGSRLFGRAAWLGLENNSWGYVRIGRQLNFATEYVGIPVDPFGTGFGQLNMGAAFGVANTDRISNAIKYQTPNMSGFQAGIGYAFANGSSGLYTDPVGTSGTGYNFATSNNTRQVTLGARYMNGPFYAAASYDKLYGDNARGGGNASISSWNIAGSYDFKVVKIAAGYGQTRDGVILGQGGGGTGATLNGSPIGTGENIFAPAVGTNSYIVGATIPVNPVSRVLLSWTMLTPNTNMKDAYNAQNQTAYNLAYTYDFTKRTNMYAFVGTMQNVGTVDTAKSTQVGLGLRHQF